MHNVRKSDFANFRSSLCLFVAFVKRLDMFWILIVCPVAAALACCLFAAWCGICCLLFLRNGIDSSRKIQVSFGLTEPCCCSFSHHDRSWTRTPFPLGWRLGTWSSSSLGRFAPFHFQTVQTVSIAFWWATLQNQARHVKHCKTTSSTAQGGGGSFKNRKPIGEVGCCESGIAERSHWWTERCLITLFLSLSLTIYLPTYLSIYLSLSLSFI